MHSSKGKEHGQALVLIVLAIVALVGLTGLAIDGGNAYSDRRHAQNAADTAALAAALAKMRGGDRVAQEDAARNIAAQNGYNYTGDPKVTVVFWPCGEAHTPACELGPDDAATNFVQVVITSTIDTYFAPVLGIRQVTNQVQAVARALPKDPTPWYDGNALVSLMPGCKDTSWNHFPFEFGGDQTTLVNGTGVFVNSGCDLAFKDSGNSNTLDAPAGVCIVGGISPGADGIVPAAQTDCGTQIDYQAYQLPPLRPASCENEGKLVGGSWDGEGYVVNMGGGVATVYPGHFSGPFPPGSYNRWNLVQGIYCLDNGIQLTGGTMTTDVNGDHIYNSGSEGVLFYVEGGGVHIGGNADVYLHAITNTMSPLDPDLIGYLMYVPPENGSDVTLIGGSSSTYIGTILAPHSLVNLNGGNGSDTLNLDAQIIGYSLSLSGSGSLNITYTQSSNATTYYNPEVSQYK